MASPTTTTTTNTPSSSPTGYPTTQTSIGAAAYYGAVALAVIVLGAVLIVSRILYTRRQRRAIVRERVEMSRRGEEGLPTYIETTAPNTLSYLSTPLSSLRTSRPVPPSHPAYVAPPTAAYHPNDTSAPPAYINEPPKYEDETTQVENREEGREEGMEEVDLERRDGSERRD